MSLAPPSVHLSPVSLSTPHNPSISLLPFQIAYDGPAPISTYFPTRPRFPNHTRSRIISSFRRTVGGFFRLGRDAGKGGEEEGEGVGGEEGAFRGRLVVGSLWTLPSGFSGLVFGTDSPSPTLLPTSDEKPAKRIKLDPSSSSTNLPPTTAAEGGTKGKGKEKVLMLVPDGRRRSPRKKNIIVLPKYSLDSDEEDGGEQKGEEGMMEVNTVPIQVVLQGEEEGQDVELVEGEEEGGPISTTTTPLDSQPSLPLTTTTTTTTTTTIEATPTDEGEIEIKLERDTQLLIPSSTFSSIQIYNADVELDPEEDLYAKGLLEWFAVAEKVHAY